MNRFELHSFFKTSSTVILPVIHVLDNEQVTRNIHIAQNNKVSGVFLINHDLSINSFLPIIRHVRSVYPDLWFGVNFLAVTGKEAFPILGELGKDGIYIDAYWADNACIDENFNLEYQPQAEEIKKARTLSGWRGLYFGGAAFKKQREVSSDKYEKSAKIASRWMDVVTTSGVATGEAAEKSKITEMRKGCGEYPLALASGVTPENAKTYLNDVDCFLVATGINFTGDFYNIDPEKLQRLITTTQAVI